MNEKNTFRTLWGAIIVLLLMNLGMLTWIWFMPAKRRPDPQKFFLEQELGFNEQQTKNYRDLRDKYFWDVRTIRDSIRPLKEGLLKRVADSTLTDSEVLKISMATESKMARAGVLTFKHLREVRNLCTTEQKKKFDAIIDKIAVQMARPEPPPPRREDDGPRGERPPPQDDRPPPPRD